MSVVRSNQPLAFGEFSSSRQFRAFSFGERRTVRATKFYFGLGEQRDSARGLQTLRNAS